MLHPDVPAPLRGTYAGFGDEAVIAHLLDLGVTTVELFPVHQNVPEARLARPRPDELLGLQHHRFLRAARRLLGRGPRRRAGGQVREFKAMVDALHSAGLEVVLDVVFNHTAEAGPDGPTLCFRGLDNTAYYRH